jgi:hypothetical protein
LDEKTEQKLWRDRNRIGFFVPAEQNQHRLLMHTIDNINFNIRDDAVKFGSSGMYKDWKMRQELRSGRGLMKSLLQTL